MKKQLGVVMVAAVLTAFSAHAVDAKANAEMFAKLDSNADGYISMEEAEAHADLPGAFADGDENEDNLLDLAEFAKLEVTDE
jgi:hypothetical protein